MISPKKLIKMARKWQSLASASRKRISMPRSSVNERPPSSLNKGHFVVYTADARRFALPLAYLESNIFRELLRMAEEEFGLTGEGPITLPCDSAFMNYLISMIRQSVERELEEALILSLSNFCISNSASSSTHICLERLPISCC